MDWPPNSLSKMLMPDQKSTLRVGDGEWITPITIASQEVPP